MKDQLALLVLFILTSHNRANCTNISFNIDENLEVYKKYAQLDNQLMDIVERGIKRMTPYALKASEHINISSTCRNNLFKLVSGFRKLTEWSISMLDATGKPQSGLLSGNIQMFGESDQCMETVVKTNGETDFRGQFCLFMFKVILPKNDDFFEGFHHIYKNSSGLLKFVLSKLYVFNFFDSRIGVCVPTGCTVEDISQILNYVTENSFVKAGDPYCLQKEDIPFWSNEKIFALCIFAFFLLLLVTSTILDNTLENWKDNKLGLPASLLQCFSLTRNFPKFIDTKYSGDAVTCFYGIRVLSIFWIVMCHEYIVQIAGTASNHVLNAPPFMQSFFAQIVLNGFTATEIFFFLGGFVNCYTRVKLQANGKRQPSFWKVIVHRLWRIYPTLCVGFLILILLSDVRVLQSELAESCRKHFWKNLLFVNNFFKPFGVCMAHTWYLCADMQMFLLSLITIPVLLRKEKIGLYLHIGIICIANIGCFLLWWIEQYPPSPALIPNENWSNFNMRYYEYHARIYMLPFLHIASYYIGIVIGYVVACKKEKKFTKTYAFLGWLAATFFYTSTIFMTYRWNSGTLYTNLESSLYASLSKSIIVLCVAWMCYCCITGQARPINYILSLKMWVPLSRLTFMTYIVSFLVQTHYLSNLNFGPDFEDIVLVWSYFGNLSISMLLSLALVLLVESPLVALEKVVFRRNQDENKPPHTFQKEIDLNGVKGNDFKENENVATIHL